MVCVCVCSLHTKCLGTLIGIECTMSDIFYYIAGRPNSTVGNLATF